MTTAATRKVSALRYRASSTWSSRGARRDSRPPTVVEHREDQRRQHRGEAVGGDQRQLVGRLQLVLAQHVRDGGLLGRDPEQADRLDQELRDEQPHQLVDERDRGEQREPQHVGDDHRLAPVEPVGERAGQRAQDDRGQQPEEQDGAEREVLAAAKPSTSEVAVAVIASRPSQSPKLDSDIDSQSLRKSRTRSTARTLATSPTDPRRVGGRAADCVVGRRRRRRRVGRIGTPRGSGSGLRCPSAASRYRPSAAPPFRPATTVAGRRPGD